MSDLSAGEVRALRDLLSQLEGDRWTRATLRGGLPRMVVRTALPTASADWAYALVTIPGGAGAADVTYQCLKSAADTYSWKAVVTG